MHAIRPHLEGKSHIIWDWNGTLLNDIELCLESISAQLSEHGLAPLTRERYPSIFRFPIREYYRDLGFDFDRVPFERLADAYIAHYAEHVRDCALFAGAHELLRSLAEAGFRSSILSAAKQEHLDFQTRHFGIRDLFERVYGIADHYAASKIERGRQLLNDLGAPIETTILIGDTDHDLEVGRHLGIEVLLLGDGHQSFDRLRAIHDRVIANRYSFE